ncbi:hypothetical protein BH18THE2_BH18THE2_22300 [soil metagenome]
MANDKVHDDLRNDVYHLLKIITKLKANQLSIFWVDNYR